MPTSIIINCTTGEIQEKEIALEPKENTNESDLYLEDMKKKPFEKYKGRKIKDVMDEILLELLERNGVKIKDGVIQ